MAISTVSSLSESFMSGAPEESSSGHIQKLKAGPSSDETEEEAVGEDGEKMSVVDEEGNSEATSDATTR